MSQENVEVVQTMARAFNAGDEEGVSKMLSPHIEYHELA